MSNIHEQDSSSAVGSRRAHTIDVHQRSKLLKVQAKLNKMKNFMNMEMELRKNKEEFNKIVEQINQAESDLNQKKRQMIASKLYQIEARKRERNMKEKQSNEILLTIKNQHKQRRKRLESLMSDYKKQYDQLYEKKLSQRRVNQKVNIQQIFCEETGVSRIASNKSRRVKTQTIDQGTSKVTNNKMFFNERKTIDASRKQRAKILLQKRIQYGNRVQLEKLHEKVSLEKVLLAKGRIKKGGFDANIDRYNQQVQKRRKQRLNTNFSGSIQVFKTKQIQKIVHQHSPASGKLNKLKNIVDGLNIRYRNGQTQTLDYICSASIARANIFLQQS